MVTRDDIRDAIQAAAIADHFDLAAEIAERYGWKGICLCCATAAPTVTYTHKGFDWPVCGPCQVALAPSRFVFRPGGNPSGNVFTDWPKLVASAQRHGGSKTVSFDDSIEPAVIPPGTWDMSGCVMRGSRPYQPVRSQGASLVDPKEIHDFAFEGIMLCAALRR